MPRHGSGRQVGAEPPRVLEPDLGVPFLADDVRDEVAERRLGAVVADEALCERSHRRAGGVLRLLAVRREERDDLGIGRQLVGPHLEELPPVVRDAPALQLQLQVAEARPVAVRLDDQRPRLRVDVRPLDPAVRVPAHEDVDPRHGTGERDVLGEVTLDLGPPLCVRLHRARLPLVGQDDDEIHARSQFLHGRADFLDRIREV